MKSGIVIYRSKYGSSRKYAGRLAEKTGFDCIETAKAKPEALAPYRTVVLCGGIYASGIAGLSFLRRNIRQLSGKKLAVFCVGASPYDQKAFEELKVRNLKTDLKDIPVFYGRGAWDEQSMSFKDRTLCRLLQKAVAKSEPDTREPWMEALLCAAGQKADWTDEKYLEPLLRYIGQEASPQDIPGQSSSGSCAV